MNNVDFGRRRDCSGCFACEAVCKAGAINIIWDNNGFYKPDINEELCVGCGICKKVCYSHLGIKARTDNLKGWYGWHKDEAVLKRSASGGITSAISQAALDNGYIIIGCSYDHSNKKAKHIIIKERGEICKILGSKYFQSDLSDMLRSVKKLPRDTKMVFFGTPCQVLGFKKFLAIEKYNLGNVLLVELFCHGIASPLLWSEYISQSRVKGLKDVRFRTKQYGWHIPANEFVTDKEAVATKRFGDAFFTAYYSTEFFNRSCYNCEIKRNLANSDLRIGDFWGGKFSANKTGVSCIVSASEKGELWLEKCRQYFCLFEGDLEEILDAQSYNKNHSFNERNWNENFELLRKFGLKHSLRNIDKRKPFSRRLRRKIYNLLRNIKSKLNHSPISKRE